MVVGILRLTFVIGGARSLKDKRQALRKMIDRTRARYNVSIAEVGENDVWQRAVVGITAVANDHSFVNEVLDKVVRDLEALGAAELVNREMEIETYSQMSSDWRDKPMLDPDPQPERNEHASEFSEDGEGYLTEEDLP
jgi:uncharacterized protein YlxP (DUF503 family)